MSHCGNSRHQLLSNDILATGMDTAPALESGAIDPGDGVLFVYYGADAVVITATAAGRSDQLAPMLAANPRLRCISE